MILVVDKRHDLVQRFFLSKTASSIKSLQREPSMGVRGMARERKVY